MVYFCTNYSATSETVNILMFYLIKIVERVQQAPLRVRLWMTLAYAYVCIAVSQSDDRFYIFELKYISGCNL